MFRLFKANFKKLFLRERKFEQINTKKCHKQLKGQKERKTQICKFNNNLHISLFIATQLLHISLKMKIGCIKYVLHHKINWPYRKSIFLKPFQNRREIYKLSMLVKRQRSENIKGLFNFLAFHMLKNSMSYQKV